MMQLVVQAGTGTTAQIPGVAGRRQDGHRGAGVGGRLRRLVRLLRPGEQPTLRRRRPVVEKQLNGFGASVSAPIAKAILEKLLGR